MRTRAKWKSNSKHWRKQAAKTFVWKGSFLGTHRLEWFVFVACSEFSLTWTWFCFYSQKQPRPNGYSTFLLLSSVKKIYSSLIFLEMRKDKLVCLYSKSGGLSDSSFFFFFIMVLWHGWKGALCTFLVGTFFYLNWLWVYSDVFQRATPVENLQCFHSSGQRVSGYGRNDSHKACS